VFIVHFSSNQIFFNIVVFAWLLCFVAHHRCLVAHYLAALIVTPCWCALLHLLSCFIVFTSHLAICALLLSFSRPAIFATLLLTPCYLSCFAFITLLLSFALLLAPFCPTIVPCYFALLVDGPCYPAIVPCYFALLVVGPCYSPLLIHLFQVPPTPTPPPIVASLPCCFALSIGTPSPLSCANGGTWSNTNKLHPTIEVFFFLCFVFCLFVIFFELNTFCFSVVCEF